MAAPRSPNPYTTPSSLEDAKNQAGGVHHLATEVGVSESTIRKWCKQLGVSTTSTGKSGNPSVTSLGRITDDELGVLLGTFTTSRLSVILASSETMIKQESTRRGVRRVEHSAGPAAALLTQRVRSLEKSDRATSELARSIRYAADQAPLPPPLPRVRVANMKRGARVDVIFHVSDIQYGQVVGGDVPGGAYSPRIFEEDRLPRYVEAGRGILDTIASGNPIGTVWIIHGGDFVEGWDVFAGQVHHLAMDPGLQVVRLANAWAPAVDDLACHAKTLGAKRVASTGVVGNHGIHSGRKAGAVPPTFNYDWLCYDKIRDQLKASRHVDWVDPAAHRAIYFRAAGHTILCTHGDQDRGGGLVGVPVVTGLRNDLSVRVQTGVQHRYHLKGHYHRPTSITIGHDIQTLWNGAWPGASNLSVGRGGASAPMQYAYTIHPEWGLQSSWPIQLEQVRVPVDIVA